MTPDEAPPPLLVRSGDSVGSISAISSFTRLGTGFIGDGGGGG